MRGTGNATCRWALAAACLSLAMRVPHIMAEDAPDQPKLETKLIDVSDLVGAVTSINPDATVADEDAEQSISDLITSTVAVDSWETNGGPCSLRPSPAGNQLVITQKPETIAAIEKLLGQLRQPLRTTVVIETRVLAVDPKMLGADTRALLAEGAAADGALPAVLDRQKADALLAGGRLNQWTVAAPRSLTRSGQRTYVKIGSTTRYLAGYSAIGGENGKMTYKPISDEAEQGITISLRASASADRKTISLHVHPTLQVLSKLAWTPAQLGENAPALMIQTPDIAVREMDCDTEIPDGGMAIAGRLPAAAIPGLGSGPGAANLREGNDLYIVVRASLTAPPVNDAASDAEQKVP